MVGGEQARCFFNFPNFSTPLTPPRRVIRGVHQGAKQDWREDSGAKCKGAGRGRVQGARFKALGSTAGVRAAGALGEKRGKGEMRALGLTRMWDALWSGVRRR
jgi:hypothetical protein